MDLDLLRKWFLENKREFPWRENPNPYQVLVSEVMLQQTRASVVISYYLKWMERFPCLKALAEASEDEVIKIWEGLGYYARARALHKAAQWILSHHVGIIPSTDEELRAIPGIGPYTSGALRSFAFQQKAPAIDGNVARVLSRYLALELDIGTSAAKKTLHDYLEEILTDDKGWIEMEALIELGATHCSKVPSCSRCPIKAGCKAYHSLAVLSYPVKKKPKQIIKIDKEILCLISEGFVLIKKNPSGQIMADLYEFPTKEEIPSFKGTMIKPLLKVIHSFTQYRASLYPSVWEIEQGREVQGFEWVLLSEASKYPFSAGHKKILAQLVNFAKQ